MYLAAAIDGEVEFLYVLEDISYALPVLDWDDLQYPMNLIKTAATEGANKAIDILEKQAEGLGVKTNRKIVTGDPAKIIVEEAKNFDLLVLGTFGRSEIVEYLMGGVANKIIKKVSCPVFLVRYPSEKMKIKKVAD